MSSGPAEAPVSSQGPPGFALLDYWRPLYSHRLWILAAAALFTAVAVFREVAEPPTYTATAQMVIEREDPFVVNFRRVTEASERWGGDELLRTHLRLIGSPAVARDVVKQLG